MVSSGPLYPCEIVGLRIVTVVSCKMLNDSNHYKKILSTILFCQINLRNQEVFWQLICRSMTYVTGQKDIFPVQPHSVKPKISMQIRRMENKGELDDENLSAAQKQSLIGHLNEIDFDVERKSDQLLMDLANLILQGHQCERALAF